VWQATPYTFPVALAALFAATLGLFVWRRRRLASGSAEFAVFAAAVTVWCLANALEFARADLGGKIRWTKVEYFGVVTVPPLWLLCVARYSGSDGWLTRRRLGLLMLVPTITLSALELTVTNPVLAREGPRSGGGHGLIGMRERATLLGGSFDTECPAGAFRIRARIPYGRDRG